MIREDFWNKIEQRTFQIEAHFQQYPTVHWNWDPSTSNNMLKRKYFSLEYRWLYFSNKRRNYQKYMHLVLFSILLQSYEITFLVENFNINNLWTAVQFLTAVGIQLMEIFTKMRVNNGDSGYSHPALVRTKT